MSQNPHEPQDRQQPEPPNQAPTPTASGNEQRSAPQGQGQQYGSAAPGQNDSPAPGQPIYGAPQPPNSYGVPTQPQQPQGQPHYGAPAQGHVPQGPYGDQPPYSQGPYGQQPYGQVPYGYPSPYPEQKSRILAGLLGLFFGGLGVHRFYLGHTGIGIAQIIVTFVTFGLGWIWGFIEGIMILAGAQMFRRDARGIPLKE